MRIVQTQRGVGFVELLVTIGIISVLAGLLLSAITRIRTYSNAVKCRAQLHQIGVALSAYAADNHGWLAPFPEPVGIEHSRGWPERVLKVPRGELFLCTTRTEQERHSYPLNTWIALSGNRSASSQAKVPTSRVVLAGENKPGINDEYHVYVPPHQGDGYFERFRHGGKLKTNYLWLDYHVSNEPVNPAPGALDDWHTP